MVLPGSPWRSTLSLSLVLLPVYPDERRFDWPSERVGPVGAGDQRERGEGKNERGESLRKKIS